MLNNNLMEVDRKRMTLACLANQSCTEFVPAQTQLVFYFDKKKEETIAFMQTNSAYLEFKISVSTEEITEFARSYQRNPFYLFLLDFSRLNEQCSDDCNQDDFIKKTSISMYVISNPKSQNKVIIFN